MTNAHVVEDADTVRVKLADDREFDAKVKGRDARLDVAILELQGAKDLQPVSLGSSDALRVGEYVVAIGNPFGLGDTVTLGIVSAKGRALGAGPYDDFIQTDASINPGNSGGPLFDLRGQMVGINTAINPEGKGIGFAIPIDDVKDVLPQLLANGHVAHGRLGVSIQPVNGTLAKALGMTHAKGALVGEVESGGPADKAGLKPGDVIVSVDQTEITHSTDLPRIIARHAPSSKVTLEVIRAGALQTFEVTLGQLKDDDDSTQPSSAEGAPSSQPQQQQPTTPPSPPKEPREAQLGLSLSDASNGHGALVDKVKPGSAAEETLESGDVITEVNHTPVTTGADAAKAFESAPKDVPVLLRVDRNGTQRYIAVQHH